MKRKKPEDVDATRVSPDGSAPGPSETQLFSQVVQEAEANEVNRTTVAGDATGSTRILDRDRSSPRASSGTAGGAFFWLAAGATAGAIALVVITRYSTR